MLKRQINCKQNGQTMLEYTLVIGIVIVALVSMSQMLKRGTQGMVKFVADQIGNQHAADQQFDETGHLVSSETRVQANANTRTVDRAGNQTYIYDDTIRTDSKVHLNQGFQE